MATLTAPDTAACVVADALATVPHAKRDLVAMLRRAYTALDMVPAGARWTPEQLLEVARARAALRCQINALEAR